jgi:hypothetical protein
MGVVPACAALPSRVKLEVGVQAMVAAGQLAPVADPLELVAEAPPVPILAGEGEVLLQGAGEHSGAQHGGGEARALLVGPVDQLDGMLGLDPMLVEAAQDLEPGENAEDAVEPPSRRLGVEVAPDRDGRELAPATPAACEDVSHVVEPDVVALGPAGFHEPVAHAAILVAERQSAEPAARGGTDATGFRDRVPEP